MLDRCISGIVSTDVPTGLTKGKPPRKVGILPKIPASTDYLNRWIQPDTIVPDPSNPQSLNRYSYVNNRPLNFTDPSGHRPCEDDLCSPPPNIHGILRKVRPSASFRSPLSGLGNRTVWQGDDGDNHPGIDYDDAPNTTVRASANGVAILADACSALNCVDRAGQTGPAFNGGYGNVIVIEYPYNSLPAAVQGDLNLQEDQSLYMLYPHLRDAPTLQSGDTVGPGQIIGDVGSTGNSTGPHLHFETRTGTTGSLNFGDMCTAACTPTANDPYPRFDAWYNSQRFSHFDPATLHYYTARELRMLQP